MSTPDPVHPLERPEMIPRAFREAKHSRMNGMLNVYHQVPGEDARQTQWPIDMRLELKETPVSRSIDVGDKWAPLELFWLEPGNVGTVTLYNKTGTNLSRNPTPEELEAIEKSTVFVMPYRLAIPPRMLAVIPVHEYETITLQCSTGIGRVDYVVYPR